MLQPRKQERTRTSVCWGRREGRESSSTEKLREGAEREEEREKMDLKIVLKKMEKREDMNQVL